MPTATNNKTSASQDGTCGRRDHRSAIGQRRTRRSNAPRPPRQRPDAFLRPGEQQEQAEQRSDGDCDDEQRPISSAIDCIRSHCPLRRNAYTNPGRAPKVCFSDFAEGLSRCGFSGKAPKIGPAFSRKEIERLCGSLFGSLKKIAHGRDSLMPALISVSVRRARAIQCRPAARATPQLKRRR